MEREIGRIVEVKGTRVRAELFMLMPPYIIEGGNTYIAPRINSFVKTRVGLDIVICQIIGEYYDNYSKGEMSGYYLELDVKGYFENARFIQGLRILPIVGADIELLSQDEMNRINNKDVDISFEVGRNLFEMNQRLRLDYNAIMPSHIGIFGNTGSGKSNTLARIVKEYYEILQGNENGKIIIFDINNEYGKDSICNKQNKVIYDLKTNSRRGSFKKIPLEIDSLNEDDWCVLLNAREATQQPVIKTACRDERSVNEYINDIKNMVKSGQHKLFNAIRYNLNEYLENVDKFLWHSSGENFYCNINGIDVWEGNNPNAFYEELNKIKIKYPTNKWDIFLFKLYFAVAKHVGQGTQYDFLAPLLKRAEKMIQDFEKVFCDNTEDLFEKKNLAIVQLGNVNNDMKEIIPSILSRLLMDNQIKNRGNGQVNSILNIVIDEAHNILYENGGDKKHYSMTLSTFERIVKEGRKFGVFLWLASQRPSDISSTIISQMHNYFIHKLVNPSDIGAIKKVVAFMDEKMLNSMTVLGPGECIVSGTGIDMPCFVYINQLDKKKRPNSEDVILIGKKGIFRQSNIHK